MDFLATAMPPQPQPSKSRRSQVQQVFQVLKLPHQLQGLKRGLEMKLRLLSGQQYLSKDFAEYLQAQAQNWEQVLKLDQQQALPLAEQVKAQAQQVQALLADLVQAQFQVVAQAQTLVLQAEQVDQLARAAQVLAEQEQVLARLELAQVSVRQMAQG